MHTHIYIYHISTSVKRKNANRIIFKKTTCVIQQLCLRLEVLPVFHVVRYKTAMLMYILLILN